MADREALTRESYRAVARVAVRLFYALVLALLVVGAISVVAVMVMGCIEVWKAVLGG